MMSRGNSERNAFMQRRFRNRPPGAPAAAPARLMGTRVPLPAPWIAEFPFDVKGLCAKTPFEVPARILPGRRIFFLGTGAVPPQPSLWLLRPSLRQFRLPGVCDRPNRLSVRRAAEFDPHASGQLPLPPRRQGRKRGRFHFFCWKILQNNLLWRSIKNVSGQRRV